MGMIGALGIPRASKKGLAGSLLFPFEKGLIGVLGIPGASKKGLTGYQPLGGMTRGMTRSALGPGL